MPSSILVGLPACSHDDSMLTSPAQSIELGTLYLRELLDKFDKNPKLKIAFDALTPGRQRGYLLHFSDAKKSETRARRIKKYEQDILSGKGMHDQ